MEKIIKTVASEIQEVLGRVDTDEAIRLADELNQVKRIFVAGTGRSGLIGKVFAMRLMHSNFPIYVVGETITPSIKTGDLLVLISGSGSTGSLVQYAEKAKEIDAKVALVTTNKDSAIGRISDFLLTIPAATKKRLPSEPDTIQPLGSQFDQSAHLLLDAIIVYLLEQQPEGNSHSKLNQKHANLE
ncbi:6-phospho-3-hexuloisomerase [Alkalihalobacillus sp. TS-13]|uniref:6-phospho-3-hexuloisomerase n=1 Tax=Alkalihalobacillus sp. TS-13 TaxID=2842455 RepID=UPI001C8761D9|nr:6-phospho-3-hexuloisomerase [Alkalihalobacillus sp. TS-13]